MLIVQVIIVLIVLIALSVSDWRSDKLVCQKDDSMQALINQHVLVRGRFGSRSNDIKWFLLDTGSSALVLDEAYATTVASTPGEQVTCIGAEQSNQESIYVDGGVLLRNTGPEIRLEPTVALVQNLENLFGAIVANNGWTLPPDSFGGIIGFTSIKDLLVRIDYKNKTLTCTPQQCLADSLVGMDFRLATDTNFAVVAARVSDHWEDWIVDTGSALTVHNVKPTKAAEKRVLMIDGPVDLSQESITLHLAGKQLKMVAWIPHKPMQALHGFSGCIGSDVLSRFVVSICYRSGKIRLE